MGGAVRLGNGESSCTNQLLAFGRRPKRNCTGRTECLRLYDSHLIDCSANEFYCNTTEAAGHLQRAHWQQRMACSNGGVLSSGGWCLSSRGHHRSCHGYAGTARHSDCIFTLTHRTPEGMTRSYYNPRNHVYPDERIGAMLSRLLSHDDSSGRHHLTVKDFGAGVGEYGHLLLAYDRRHRWAGFDGAGNVEEVADGFVDWFDLSRPLLSPVSELAADWVVSLEVGEHIPDQFEPMFIRNLHASNCRGVVLSWGQYGPGGHGDATYHTQAYLVQLFDSLGYDFMRALTDKTKRMQVGRRGVSRHWWFDRNLYIFRRREVVWRPGCVAGVGSVEPNRTSF